MGHFKRRVILSQHFKDRNKLIFSFFLSCVSLGPHLWHMEGSKLGVESELQLPAYATATTTPDPSRICGLHHSSWQCQILNPLREATDGTRNFMVPSQICFRCTHNGNSINLFFLKEKPRVEFLFFPKWKT